MELPTAQRKKQSDEEDGRIISNKGGWKVEDKSNSQSKSKKCRWGHHRDSTQDTVQEEQHATCGFTLKLLAETKLVGTGLSHTDSNKTKSRRKEGGRRRRYKTHVGG